MRGRRSAELARVYRASGRSASERYRDLVQRRVSVTWPSQAMLQSVTYLVKSEWPKIALIYAMARLVNDMWPAPGRLVTPDFAAHARGLLEPRSQPYKFYDGKP